MSGQTVRAGAFDGLETLLRGGFAPELASADHFTQVMLDDIEVLGQVREEFEDDEHSLADLGASLEARQLQNIIVRPRAGGAAGSRPYLLVAGERRVRSARAKGLDRLWALVAVMDDEEALDVQFQENVHHKNLTQIEEAKRVQRDLDALGNVDAVLAKYKKGRPWLSKRLALLKLPPEAKRLLSENVSADLEVINAVALIAKADAGKAAEVVESLKAGRGKVNAREAVSAAKAAVKPPKRKVSGPSQVANADDGETSVAAPRDRSLEAPGAAEVRGGRAPGAAVSLACAYMQVYESGSSPSAVLAALPRDQVECMGKHLAQFFETGKQCKGLARAVLQGLRNGQFATDGDGALAMLSFLHGAEAGVKFSVLDVLGCARP